MVLHVKNVAKRKEHNCCIVLSKTLLASDEVENEAESSMSWGKQQVVKAFTSCAGGRVLCPVGWKMARGRALQFIDFPVHCTNAGVRTPQLETSDRRLPSNS